MSIKHTLNNIYQNSEVCACVCLCKFYLKTANGNELISFFHIRNLFSATEILGLYNLVLFIYLLLLFQLCCSPHW